MNITENNFIIVQGTANKLTGLPQAVDIINFWKVSQRHENNFKGTLGVKRLEKAVLL